MCERRERRRRERGQGHEWENGIEDELRTINSAPRTSNAEHQMNRKLGRVWSFEGRRARSDAPHGAVASNN